MTDVSVTQLRRHTTDIIDRAAAGERVPITRNGRVIAYAIPYTDLIRLTNLEGQTL